MEPAGSESPEGRPHAGRLREGGSAGPFGRSLTEVLELLAWLRENGVEIVSLRESVDQDRAMGREMMHLAIVFTEIERDLARERTLAGLDRIRTTGKYIGRRKGASRKRASTTVAD